MQKRLYLILVALLGLHLFFLTNLQFTVWPEILSFPYLHNNGFLIYKDMIHPYPPLLTIILSLLYKLFGYRVFVVQIFTWILILINDLFIFLISLKVTKKYTAALLSVLLYIWIQPFLEGNMLWFDLAVVPFVLAGIYFAISYLQEKTSKNLIAGSVFFTLACLTKQTTLVFPFVFFVILITQRTSFKKLGLFLLTPFLFLLPLLVRLFQENQFTDFWNWVFYYPFKFWTKFPGYVQMDIAFHQGILLFLIFAPIALVFFQKKFFSLINIVLLIFFVISLVTVYPRFSFFHLQTSIAVGSTMLGIILSRLKLSTIYLIFILGVWSIYIQIPVVAADWGKSPRFYESVDLEFSKIIKEKTNLDDNIYLLGNHSGNYVYSDRLPAKPWIDNFGWYFEIPGVQEKMLSRWESNYPKLIFWQKPQIGNWYDLGVYQPKLVVEYIKANYDNNGEVYKGVELWKRRQK